LPPAPSPGHRHGRSGPSARASGLRVCVGTYPAREQAQVLLRGEFVESAACTQPALLGPPSRRPGAGSPRGSPGVVFPALSADAGHALPACFSSETPFALLVRTEALADPSPQERRAAEDCAAG
jgi:hypothetical protein